MAPDIQFSQNPNGKYGYNWIARSLSKKDENANSIDYLLGEERDLEYFVDLDAGEYQVTLTVTDSIGYSESRKHSFICI